MNIFLSHNHQDKEIVEPIALALKSIYGKDRVFYDSWSIQPGDGIIDRMNQGLSAPDFVYYFVSSNSIESRMVDLEWQNALMQHTQGKTKLVPVRVDGAPMPALLMQSHYIDMYSLGISETIRQVLEVCNGGSTFTPKHEKFENIYWVYEMKSDKKITIEVHASRFFDANVKFLFETSLTHDEIGIDCEEAGLLSGEHAHKDYPEIGRIYQWVLEPVGKTIRPGNPLTFTVYLKKGRFPQDLTVYQHTSGRDYRPIPLKGQL